MADLESAEAFARSVLEKCCDDGYWRDPEDAEKAAALVEADRNAVRLAAFDELRAAARAVSRNPGMIAGQDWLHAYEKLRLGLLDYGEAMATGGSVCPHVFCSACARDALTEKGRT